MQALELPAEQTAALDAVIARGHAVVDEHLLQLAQACIAYVLDGGPEPTYADQRDRDVCALVEQMLIDVANLNDATVAAAAQHFVTGGLANFVMTSYALEARTRLTLAAQALGASE